MKKITISMMGIILLSLFNQAYAQEASLGHFEDHSDIGNVKWGGSAKYNEESQQYYLTGAGTNMWLGEDEFHFLWKRIKGDFIVRARMEFVGEGVDPHRKIGWMIRNSLDKGSAYADATVHGDGLTSLQYRRTQDAMTEEVKSEAQAPDVIQLERKGNNYFMSTARFGEPFKTVRLADLALADEVYIGLFICSHHAEVIEKAVFSNVRIIRPVPEDYTPYEDYLGSQLEIMDVENGLRKVIYTSPKSLQAPNWTMDGKSLIYNSEGLLYTFNLETNNPEVLNTGFANNNNNDHVLSFDGKQVAISHHNEEDNNHSTIYTLPIEGSSSPVQITPKGVGASYLHGWSPDGKTLTYCANRKGEYDVYTISIDNRKEKRLTSAEGLDDGPEYSPDGQLIYFNSNRTGTMQIWRMKPDGSEQQQMTFDDYNDWFPHISPDGKWMVFLSYGPEIDSGDHPFYKHIYLRLMPTGGGEAKIIAYVYGGQGTINVPSWSPDSKKIAFISNTNF